MANSIPQPKLAKLPPGLRVAAARAFAAKKMPYFEAGVAQMGMVEAPGLGTVAVTEEGQLMVDLEAIGEETAEETGTGLLHEYLHVYFNHTERFRRLVKSGVLKDPEDRGLWNTCTDCEINCSLRDAYLPMTFGKNQMVLPDKLGWPNGLLAEQYVELARKQRKKVQEMLEKLGGKPKRGCGHCGSGGGQKVENEPKADVDAESRAEDVRVQVDQAVYGAVAKGRGSVPLGIALYAKARTSPAEVSWQQKLAKAGRDSAALLSGRDDYTFEMPAREMQMFEGMDPMPVLPAMKQTRAEVAFCFDTSGSMGNDQDKLLREAYSILQALPGSRLTVLACDASVHSLKAVRSAREIAPLLKGGGGTDFRPAFATLERRKPRPDLLVFGTDGYGCYPSKAPPFKVIWLLVPGGQISVPWGERVHTK